MDELRIATRRSKLAITQAQIVARMVESMSPGIKTRLVEVSTSGDLDRHTPVATLTEVGAFVRAVQQAVLDGSADLAVHSCKDLPVEGPSELAALFPQRAAPADVLCGHALASLPEGAVIGTGSPRRAAQMKALRPDVQVRDIRGNVDTRLDKIAAGEFDAVILAEAGLARLGRTDQIAHRFDLDEMVPAPAQGALAVEALAGGAAIEAAAGIDDPDTRRAVEAERELLEQSRAGCRSALGALAVTDGQNISMSGFVEDERGPRRGRATGSTPFDVAAELRHELEI